MYSQFVFAQCGQCLCEGDVSVSVSAVGVCGQFCGVCSLCQRICDVECGQCFSTCGQCFTTCGQCFSTCGQCFSACGQCFSACGQCFSACGLLEIGLPWRPGAEGRRIAGQMGRAVTSLQAKGARFLHSCQHLLIQHREGGIWREV